MTKDERKELTGFRRMIRTAESKGALVSVQWAPGDQDADDITDAAIEEEQPTDGAYCD